MGVNGLPTHAILVAVAAVAITAIALAIHFNIPDTKIGVENDEENLAITESSSRNHKLVIDGMEYVNGRIEEIIGQNHIMGNYSTIIHRTSMDALSKQHQITENHITARYGFIIGTILAIFIGISGTGILVYKIKNANSTTYLGKAIYKPNHNMDQPDAENQILPEVVLD